jgi:hypothetical protein
MKIKWLQNLLNSIITNLIKIGLFSKYFMSRGGRIGRWVERVILIGVPMGCEHVIIYTRIDELLSSAGLGTFNFKA